jgi:hypothetical protein
MLMIIGQFGRSSGPSISRSIKNDQGNSVSAVIQSTGHGLVNQPRITIFDSDWLVPITDEESP